MTAVPDRIEFAVAAMAPQPGSRILEIGCGNGTAVTLVRERIGPHGAILGVDRSATQIDRARRRTLGDGVELRVCEFPDCEFPGTACGGSFDLIFAIGVPAFRAADPSVPESAATLLAPGGELWVFDEPPPGVATGPTSMRISTLLSSAGFAIVDIVERGRTVGVLAAPIVACGTS
ncbi:MAG: methyltransferase domain-containing protein [Rhodococcus sp. (in: high G+C Gram-positive bacteria)]|uniref:class I SAM-dependent DNA methyltransferase n=1 Tax=Rhodococcus sp. TaxID=1831 RepID=UPI003BB4FFC5